MKTLVYFHKWRRVVACPLPQTAGWLWSSPAQPRASLTGQGCRGSSPLWATDLYERRMFVSMHEHASVTVCECVWVCGRRMTLLDLYGLWSNLLEHHLAWKQKVTHSLTHIHTPTAAVPFMCVNTPTIWDPILPPKKTKKSNVRPHNCWQCHFVVAYMHILGDQTTDSIPTLCSLQPCFCSLHAPAFLSDPTKKTTTSSSSPPWNLRRTMTSTTTCL